MICETVEELVQYKPYICADILSFLNGILEIQDKLPLYGGGHPVNHEFWLRDDIWGIRISHPRSKPVLIKWRCYYEDVIRWYIFHDAIHRNYKELVPHATIEYHNIETALRNIGVFGKQSVALINSAGKVIWTADDLKCGVSRRGELFYDDKAIKARDYIKNNLGDI